MGGCRTIFDGFGCDHFSGAVRKNTEHALVQGSIRPLYYAMFIVCFRFLVTMNVHYGNYKDFKDLALCLAFNYNKYSEPGKDTKLQYKDTVHILVILSYNWVVQYLCGGSVHKGHRQALAMSFLETAQFFGGQFHNEKMTNKQCRRFDNALATKNSTGKRTG